MNTQDYIAVIEGKKRKYGEEQTWCLMGLEMVRLEERVAALGERMTPHEREQDYVVQRELTEAENLASAAVRTGLFEWPKGEEWEPLGHRFKMTLPMKKRARRLRQTGWKSEKTWDGKTHTCCASKAPWRHKFSCPRCYGDGKLPPG
jgi:hypothetical protein